MRNADEENLSRRIHDLENELEILRSRQNKTSQNQRAHSNKLPLELEEYVRYGRQMIIPQVGLPGQLALKRSSVLVIGAGGLGCPVLLYLVGAGVGTPLIFSVVDDHRNSGSCRRRFSRRIQSASTSTASHLQCWHVESSLRTESSPTVSPQHSLRWLIDRLNPHVVITSHSMGITPHNAIEILNNYDVIVDCTDAPSTRYLISDAAVVLSKPLISGSALGTEGQIAVYGYNGGPCYRCIFPQPPPPESVLTCGEGGILGPGTTIILY